MKNNIIKTTGLKGSAVTDRMKTLMGLNEGAKTTKPTHGFELVKKGSDGNVYAIVREAHEYVIKKAQLRENLAYGDFDYIGGLANKRKNFHESYAKATQALSLKLMSLHENYGGECNYSGTDLYRNDMELEENPMMVSLGDDMEFMPSEENVFSDPSGPAPMSLPNQGQPEMSAHDMAIDQMLNGTFEEPVMDEVELGFEEEEYTFDTMSDKIMESYKRLDNLLDPGLKKKI